MTVAARMTDDNVEGRQVAAPVSTPPAMAAAYTSASVIIHPFLLLNLFQFQSRDAVK
jgi:hypothetical protein